MQERYFSTMEAFNIEVAGAKFKMLARDEAHLKDFISNEIEIRSKWWKPKPGDVVVDIGAEKGLYTLQSLAMGAETVYAFEPEPRNFYELSMNLLINKFASHRGRAFPMGLLNVAGFAPLWKLGDTSSSFKVAYEDRPKPMGIFLTNTLDDVLNWFPDRVDWLKVDVEGSELETLQGAKKSLEMFSPKVLVENHTAFFPEIEDRVREFMADLHYKDTIIFKEKGVGTNNLYEKQV